MSDKMREALDALERLAAHCNSATGDARDGFRRDYRAVKHSLTQQSEAEPFGWVWSDNFFTQSKERADDLIRRGFYLEEVYKNVVTATNAQLPESEPVAYTDWGNIDLLSKGVAIEVFPSCDKDKLVHAVPLSIGPQPTPHVPELGKPAAFISKIALEELQKPECAEDMFGVTGRASGCWDVPLYLETQPTPQVPEGWHNESLIIIDRVLGELESGFVACSRCGGQEDTATLDCMGDLRQLRNLLSRAPSIAEKLVPISFSGRLVYEDDGDCNGFVWVLDVDRGWIYLSWSAANTGFYSHWMPTRLKRPEPPATGGND